VWLLGFSADEGIYYGGLLLLPPHTRNEIGPRCVCVCGPAALCPCLRVLEAVFVVQKQYDGQRTTNTRPTSVCVLLHGQKNNHQTHSLALRAKRRAWGFCARCAVGPPAPPLFWLAAHVVDRSKSKTRPRQKTAPAARLPAVMTAHSAVFSWRRDTAAKRCVGRAAVADSSYSGTIIGGPVQAPAGRPWRFGPWPKQILWWRGTTVMYDGAQPGGAPRPGTVCMKQNDFFEYGGRPCYYTYMCVCVSLSLSLSLCLFSLLSFVCVSVACGG
jgi:hypothetical protein